MRAHCLGNTTHDWQCSLMGKSTICRVRGMLVKMKGEKLQNLWGKTYFSLQNYDEGWDNDGESYKDISWCPMNGLQRWIMADLNLEDHGSCFSACFFRCSLTRLCVLHGFSCYWKAHTQSLVPLLHNQSWSQFWPIIHCKQNNEQNHSSPSTARRWTGGSVQMGSK